MPGDDWNKAANLRALLAYMWAHPGKQLLFMGGELGQPREWSESRSLDWELLADQAGKNLHRGIQDLVRDLNRAYRATPALYSQDSSPDGFSWIDANDASGNVFSFLRYGSDGSVLACIANFAGQPHEGYRVGLPFTGRWRELVNTDATQYGGSGVGNLGSVTAVARPWHGRPASATLRVPPSGVLWLLAEPDAQDDDVQESDAQDRAVEDTCSCSASCSAPSLAEAGSSSPDVPASAEDTRE
jgi:1,4-alpha-glucan branching enzyme